MGMQAMPNDTVFILGWLCGLVYCGRFHLVWLLGFQLRILHKQYSSLIPLSRTDFTKKENKEQSPIPVLLKTSLSLSYQYLLNNSM